MINLVLAILIQASVPVVNSASFIQWDDGNVGVATQTRVYLERTSGIVPDGTPDASVGIGLLQWAITAGNGKWFAVITAFEPVSGLESGPSNEISFHVLGPPGNPRIVLPPPATSTP